MSSVHVSQDNTIQQLCERTYFLLLLLCDKVNILNINPNQTPVSVSDCPVFALAQEKTYCFPDKFINYFAMLSGLHIEQFC